MNLEFSRFRASFAAVFIIICRFHFFCASFCIELKWVNFAYSLTTGIELGLSRIPIAWCIEQTKFYFIDMILIHCERHFVFHLKMGVSKKIVPHENPCGCVVSLSLIIAHTTYAYVWYVCVSYLCFFLRHCNVINLEISLSTLANVHWTVIMLIFSLILFFLFFLIFFSLLVHLCAKYYVYAVFFFLINHKSNGIWP